MQRTTCPWYSEIKTHLHHSLWLFLTPTRLPVYPAPWLPCLLLACVKLQVFSFFFEMFLINEHSLYCNSLHKIISLIAQCILSLMVFSKFLQSVLIIVGQEKLFSSTLLGFSVGALQIRLTKDRLIRDNKQSLLTCALCIYTGILSDE